MRYIFPFILIIAAVLGFTMYTNPQYQALKGNMASYQEIMVANSKAASLRAARQKLSDDYAKIPQADVDKLNKMLPDSVENVGLIIDINNIATDNGMRIRNTKVDDTTPSGTTNTVAGPNAKKYGSISLTFSVTSQYDNFLTFLQKLESSQRLVDITNVTFSSSGNQTDIYDFTVTLQTYWLK